MRNADRQLAMALVGLALPEMSRMIQYQEAAPPELLVYPGEKAHSNDVRVAPVEEPSRFAWHKSVRPAPSSDPFAAEMRAKREERFRKRTGK
jgi:hypothetical protein